MANAIPRMVNAVNRTTEPLDAMFDGQPLILLPGYKWVEEAVEGDSKKIIRKAIGAGPGGSVVLNPLPYFAAEMVKRQNPMMGTEDPENPRDFESLVGVKEWDDDIDFCEQSESVERLDRSMLDEGAQKVRLVGSKSKHKGKGKGKTRDVRLRNPVGIRADYEG